LTTVSSLDQSSSSCLLVPNLSPLCSGRTNLFQPAELDHFLYIQRKNTEEKLHYDHIDDIVDCYLMILVASISTIISSIQTMIYHAVDHYKKKGVGT
jgi:hypothetical protein